MNQLRVLSICLSLFFSNICLYALDSQYLCALIYIKARLNMINNIIKQLLIDTDAANENSSCIIYDEDEFTSQNNIAKELMYTNYRRQLLNGTVEGTKIVANNPKHYHHLKEVAQENKSNKNKTQNIIKVQPKNIENNVKNDIEKYSENGHDESIGISKIMYRTYVTELTFKKSLPINETIDKLNILICLRTQIIDAISILNDRFSLPVLLMTILIFWYIVFGLFSQFRYEISLFFFHF